MEFRIKITRLMDNSKVHDIEVFSNSRDGHGTGARCIFSCTSEEDALKFLLGFEKLVKNHTLETLSEVGSIPGQT